MQENKLHYKHYALLLITCLLACWPLTFGVFSVKNDAIHYFLPYRFQVSEALRNGEFPFWSPYLFLGYPIYGDMQSGAWNPVVWLFSIFGRYDLTLFHFENLLYVWLGGIGMYKLAYYKSRHSLTSLLIGAAYMLSGFMLSGQLINWLAAAAFIPFVILYYLRATTSGRIWDSIWTGLSLYMLLVAGYPSFFILSCYVLIGMFIVRMIENKKLSRIKWKNFIGQHIVMILVFAGLSLPAIVSYIDLFPYYQRGNGTSFNETIHNSFNWQHLLSFVFPSSIHASDVFSGTDVTCRNLYIGILTIPVLLAYPPAKNLRNFCLGLMIMFAFLFSLGDATPFRKWAYDILPAMNTFRHPSQARLFVMLGLLLLAIPGIKKMLDLTRVQDKRRMNIATSVFAGAVVLVTLLALLQSGVLRSIPVIAGSFQQIKQLIDSVTLNDVIVINGFIQIATLAFFIWWLNQKQRKNRLFAIAWMVNLVVLAQFILPVTFVSMTSPSSVNNIIHASPKGYPVKELGNSLKGNSVDMYSHFERAGLATFYNKKIGISRNTNTPSFLTQQDEFLADTALYEYVSDRPVAYFATKTIPCDTTKNDSTSCVIITYDAPAGNDPTRNTSVKITDLSANSIEATVKTDSAGIFILTQNHNKHWKANVDRAQSQIIKVNKAFMGVILEPGTHYVRFRFEPSNTITCLWIQGATVLALLVFFISTILKRKTRNAVAA